MKANRAWLLFICLAVTACLVSVPSGVKAQQKAIEIKYATAFDSFRDHEKGTLMFVERLEKAAGGRIKFISKGGPEAFPPFELVEAVRKGVIDFAEDPAGYYMAQVPIANGMRLSRLTPEQERASGAYDLFRKIAAEKANIFFLGKVNPLADFHIYSRVPVKSTADFKGMRIRSTPTYKDFILALGANPTTTTHGEIYTALERGIVQAVCSPSFGMLELGWHTQVKYIINPPFYQQDQTLIFNLDTWKKLPPDLQKLADEVMISVEKDSADFINSRMKAAYDDLLKAGLKDITLSDPEKFLEMAYDSAWKEVLSKSDPKTGPEMRQRWTFPAGKK
jgi:TRAP-type C4-dicarboxylate transport system substrate-binding protein